MFVMKQIYSDGKIMFGKHLGKHISQVPESYLVWVIEKSSFPEDVIEKCKDEIRRRKDNG